MNAPYTAYIEVEYDRTNEGDYERRMYSVDCDTTDLPFVSSLAGGVFREKGFEFIERVVIITSDELACFAPIEHFSSVREMLIFFRGVIFSRVIGKK